METVESGVVPSPWRRWATPRALTAAGAALIVAATFLAYRSVLDAGFIWDDPEHVTNNRNLRTAAGLAAIWLDPTSIPQYYPLVHTTFWLEYQAWQKWAGGYHAVNVVLHVLNALLVWRVLRRLGAPGSGLAALVFALHPVHVESVAWITERKNVLSGLFYLASFACLLDATGIGGPAARNPRRSWLAAFLFYAMALLSKTVTASLPAAFLLVAWWKGRALRPLVLRLAPFFAVGIVLGLHTAWLERAHVGAIGPEFAIPFTARVGIAARAVWFYLWKLVWPFELSFIYTRWDPAFGAAAAAALAGVVVALAGLLALRGRIGRAPLAAALFFGGTLFPALGFFNVYPMKFSFVADHFQYLASLGPIALLCAAMAASARRAAGVHPAALQAALGLALALGLGALTSARAAVYHAEEPLWRDALAKNPACWLCLNNLGGNVSKQGRTEEALAILRRAVAVRPDLFEARINLIVALTRLGRDPEAEVEFVEAVRLDSGKSAVALREIGRSLAMEGKLAEATPYLRRAVMLRPKSAKAQQDLGRALALQGLYAEAAEPMTVGLAATPDDPEAYRELGFVLAQAGRHADAAGMYREALKRAPGSAAAQQGLDAALRAAAGGAR